MATIVTGYFQLKQAKASHDTYSKWMRNMLSIENPMVIFCDSASEQMIQEMRAGKMEYTKIILTSFNEFYSYRYARNFLEHYKMDQEQRVGHNMFLYMIWSEKSHFLKRAIELNPFSTEYFVWCDIGCFRVPNTRYLHWPNPSRIATFCHYSNLQTVLVELFLEEVKIYYCNGTINITKCWNILFRLIDSSVKTRV